MRNHPWNPWRIGALAGLALVLVAAAPAQPPADLVLRNGKIVTVDEKKPEAQALDLAGRLATPGIIEGHGHFLSYGNARMQLRLADAKSWDEIVGRVAEAAKHARPGDWIRGRGWHQEKWDAVPSPNVEGFPTHASLSRVSPDNPVILTHASGHAVFVNAKALEISGITRATPNPQGGEILRDGNGEATGLLRETASALALAPPLDEPAIVRTQARLA